MNASYYVSFLGSLDPEPYSSGYMFPYCPTLPSSRPLTDGTQTESLELTFLEILHRVVFISVTTQSRASSLAGMYSMLVEWINVWVKRPFYHGLKVTPDDLQNPFSLELLTKYPAYAWAPAPALPNQRQPLQCAVLLAWQARLLSLSLKKGKKEKKKNHEEEKDLVITVNLGK